MQPNDKKPELAGPGSRSQHSTPSNFPTPASIRRRYAAYEQAKSDWLDANPSVGRADRDKAMRRIALAVRV